MSFTNWLDARIKAAVDESNADLKTDVQVMITASETAIRSDVHAVGVTATGIVQQVAQLAGGLVNEVVAGIKAILPFPL